MKLNFLVVVIILITNYSLSQGLTKNGAISGVSSEYVNKNGAIGISGVSLNGQKINILNGNLNALSLDGNDDYVSFPSSVYFNGDFTIECWVYPKSFSNWARVIDFGNGAGINNVLLAYSEGTSGKPALYIEGEQFSANQTIPLNTWTHLAATLSGTTATIYINGIDAGSQVISTPPVNVVRNNCYLGKSNWSDPNSEANFDDLRIWSTAKSSVEILASMNLDLLGNESNLITYCPFNQGVKNGSNIGVTSLNDKTTSANNGTLNNFTLTGATSNWVDPAPIIYDGTSAAKASWSAYAIKQTYPASTDGLFWIKNENINGGTPFQVYADMTTDGGGWTLIMTNSLSAGWTNMNVILRNEGAPSIASNYSIISYADKIKQSSSGFQFMIDATTRGDWGGIWTANDSYSFVSTSNTNTDITLNTMFNTWVYCGSGIEERMPYYSPGNSGLITTSSDPNNDWWGTLISSGGWSPAPYIACSGNPHPGIIWYWVR